MFGPVTTLHWAREVVYKIGEFPVGTWKRPPRVRVGVISAINERSFQQASVACFFFVLLRRFRRQPSLRAENEGTRPPVPPTVTAHRRAHSRPLLCSCAQSLTLTLILARANSTSPHNGLVSLSPNFISHLTLRYRSPNKT